MTKSKSDSLFVKFYPGARSLSLCVDYYSITYIFYLLLMGQDCSACDQNQNEHISNGHKYYQFIYQNIQCSKFIKSENRNHIINKIVSEGFYDHDLLNGKAILFSQTLGYYEGIINQKRQAHGKGRAVLLNWDEYQGFFENNKYYGNGIIRNKQNTMKFIGQWKQGQPVRGKLYNSKQNNSQIQLNNIQKLPSAKMYYASVKLPNKLKYIGQLILKEKVLIFQGKGFMQFPDGSTYDGKWFQGRMEGNGKYIWENGSYYEGAYSSGKRNGHGKMLIKKQNKTYVYDGMWFDGNPKLKSFIYQSFDSSSQASQKQLLDNQNNKK